jgi:hypothetical protein
MKSVKIPLIYACIILIAGSIVRPALSQTTGKIAGRVVEAGSRSPLMGANVLVEGTRLGAAAGEDGDFFIINVPPGTYTVRVQMMGYKGVRMENVQVSVNRTSDITLEMRETVIQGDVVVVQAEKIAVKKDQTSTIRNVSSEQIDILPVESMGGVISMQTGVVNGHFRGGRINDVAYLIDGVDVTESFGGEGRAVELEPESIEDLEVITGTFNAEYGQAMSGIVNAVTRGGSRKFEGFISASLANYLTNHKDIDDNPIFIGLDYGDLTRNQDYKFQLSGPIYKDYITFIANVRYQDNKNHLNGINRFEVNNFSNFMEDDPANWYSEATGDSSFVPMNRSKNLSFMGKLTSNITGNFKATLLYTLNNDEWHGYDHAFKYDPYGMPGSYRQSQMWSLQLNHMLSRQMFYELKLSYVDNYSGYYVFEDPFDTGYVHDAFFSNAGPGFYTGGQDKSHSRRWMKDLTSKFDYTWQINKTHGLKAGVLYTQHDLDNRWSEIRNKYSGTVEEGDYYFEFINGQPKIVFPNYTPVIYPDSSTYSDIYRVKPFEFSAYIQDKMEFEAMVINIGFRYDYFDPKTIYPDQPRNPANQLLFEDPSKMSSYPEADPQIQISPRFGLAYQLGKTALLHFSYGHFFQMPPMYAIYQNHSFQVAPTDYQTTIGTMAGGHPGDGH